MEINQLPENEKKSISSRWTIPGVLALIICILVVLMAKSCQGSYGKPGSANHETRVIEP